MQQGDKMEDLVSELRRQRVMQLKEEGMIQLELQFFTDIQTVFEKLSTTCNNIDLGNSWYLVYDYVTYIGFGIFSTRQAFKDLFGENGLIPVCPCCRHSIIFGGNNCDDHGFEAIALPEKALFPFKIWQPAEYEKLKNALSAHFNNIPFYSQSPGSVSVMTKLIGGAQKRLEEYDVGVRRVGQSLEIELLSDSQKFHSCGERDCPKQGDLPRDGSYYCRTHAGRIPEDPGSIKRRTETARIRSYDILLKKAVELRLPNTTKDINEINKIAQIQCVVRFLWDHGERGYTVSLHERQVLWKIDEDKKYIYYKEAKTKIKRCRCAGCGKVTRNVSDRSLFCKDMKCQAEKEKVKVDLLLAGHEYGKQGPDLLKIKRK